ncbi:MAG: (Fe-S)-binding protein [Myxococcota bacterium]
MEGPLREGWQDVHAKSLDCVHCGLCLSSCPTYRETGRERSSPRGRIYLMRGVAEGRIPLAETTADEAFLCLGCRACETACPSGVQYGQMLEEVRHQVDRAGLRPRVPRTLERLALRQLVAKPRRLRAAFDLLGAAQRLRLDRLLARLPGRLGEAGALLPPVPPRSARASLPERTPARGTRRGRVAFLAGCVMRELFADVNRATVEVLAANGFEVLVPREQGCCGALHAHAGDIDAARRLARTNLRAFGAHPVDALVTNSAGCGAAMRDAEHWLGEEGRGLATSVRDVCEFLDAVGPVAPLAPIEARLCYDDPCHLVHGQRVADAPRRLLAKIPSLELVAHDDPAGCCGAAGTYNLTHPEMSRAVLERKLASLAAADPDLVATGNPGCLMQIRGGAARAGLRAEVLHPVELLARSQRLAHS